MEHSIRTSCVLYLLVAAAKLLLLTFLKNYFRSTDRVSNSLDPDQDRHFVSPDLCPNFLQRLSADNKSPFTC